MKRKIKLKALPSFARSVSKIKGKEKELLIETLDELRIYLSSAQKTPGLGFKKLRKDLYEIRVDIDMRIVAVYQKGAFFLAFYGNHDDIERFLRRY